MIDYKLPDKLNISFNNQLEILEKNNVLKGISERDHTLWDSDPDEISNRLDWLDSPTEMVSHIDRIENFVKKAQEDGFTFALLLGMGGSSLTPEVFRKIFGVSEGFLDLEIIDTTDPDAIHAVKERMIPHKTLFIVATKSGGTVETLSLFKYFYNYILEVLGSTNIGEHFIAITDPGSKLEEIAKTYKFREIFLNNPNIGGRYSALSFFGMVPAALIGVDISRLLDRTRNYSEIFDANYSQKLNDGVIIGAILGEAAKQGIDKLTFVRNHYIDGFEDWVEQLVAESTGKSGKGILPIVGETPSGDVRIYGHDRVFIFSTFGNMGEFNQFKESLVSAGHPTITINIAEKYDLGDLIFTWEIATIVASHILKIHPFNQPNVESAKVLAREMMNSYKEQGKLPVFGDTEISIESLQRFLNASNPGDYVSIHAYLPPSRETSLALSSLQHELRNKYQLAVTWGYGPRFLHSTGQLHKGDGGNGLFIQIISKPMEDIPIPAEAGQQGSDHTFGMLKLAQANGDAKALVNAGRKLISFTIDSNPSDKISKISRTLNN